MSCLLGLTGSIGMGKSTTARMFATHGAAVWDADAAVHEIYRAGGAAVAPIKAVWPQAIIAGAVDRGALKAIIAADGAALPRLEAIVHPLVAEHRAAFIKTAASDILLFDIPLLFETQADLWLDKVAVVSAPFDVQKQRVLARPGMDDAQFAQILSRQMPDAEKRARADWVIPTLTLEGAQAAVDAIVAQIREA